MNYVTLDTKVIFMISLKVAVWSALFMFLGCKSTKKEEPKEQEVAMAQKEEINNTEQVSINNCPEDGTCTWSIQGDTNLVMKEDTIGALYPVFEKEEGTHTIKFSYERAKKEGLADSGYKELVYFRIPWDTKSLTLKDEALQEVGLTYGRLCFCRGATGYQPVNKGTLTLTKAENGYHVILTFENGKFPQIINNLDGIATEITE